MGITGYCLKADAIAMINDFSTKQEDTTTEIIGRITSYRQSCFNEVAQSFLGLRLAEKYPFNPKIDNFLELENIESVVISSIQDEEIIGKTRPVGVCQFYNRVASDVTQEDLIRMFHIRKLIGAMTVKCEYVQVALQTIIGMAEERDKCAVIEKMADDVCTHHTYHHNDNEIQKYADYLQGRYYPLVKRLEKETEAMAAGHEVDNQTIASDEIRSNND